MNWLTVCSLTSLATSVINFELLCSSGDTCALIVFDFCHLCCVGKLCLNRRKVLMVLSKEWLIQSVGSGNWAFG